MGKKSKKAKVAATQPEAVVEEQKVAETPTAAPEQAIEEPESTDTEPIDADEEEAGAEVAAGSKGVTHDRLKQEVWNRMDGQMTRTLVDSVIRELAGLMGGHLMAGRTVRIPGLGGFSITEHKERAGVNPRTGEKIVIPARRAVKFSPAKALKDAVNG
jgi:DNA-binding protein HU-beta